MAIRSITVNAIGFLEKDRRMIRNILSVASNKDYSYQLTMIGGEAVTVQGSGVAARGGGCRG